jgi:hypothetical protein
MTLTRQVVDPYSTIIEEAEDLGQYLNYEPQIISQPLDPQNNGGDGDDDYRRNQYLFNVDAFGDIPFQDDNDQKGETLFSHNKNNDNNDDYRRNKHLFHTDTFSAVPFQDDNNQKRETQFSHNKNNNDDDDYQRNQPLFNINTFGNVPFQDDNNQKRETPFSHNNLVNSDDNKGSTVYIRPPTSTAVEPTKTTYVENFSYSIPETSEYPTNPVSPVYPATPASPVRPARPVSYEVDSSDEFFDTENNDNGFNNAPGPPYFIDPPEHAVYALPPAETGPIFRGEVNRIEFSSASPTTVAPKTSTITDHFSTPADLYSRDVYSQQDFAQLQPFFYPSDLDPRPGASVIKLFSA